MGTNRVIVVGGGLAGLSCAIELTRAGVDCRLFEGSDAVGGRVRTDRVDGFRLDRGFQVLLTAYPEAERLLDYEALRLRRFFPGAVLRSGRRFRRLADPWRRPLAGVASLLRGTVSLGDARRMARLRRRTRDTAAPSSTEGQEQSTRARLKAEGFSDGILETFFRPFFAGVFLDADLETTERQMEFVFRMFSAGDIAVPAHGMGEIPRQLAKQLPDDAITLHTRVDEVTRTNILTKHLASHEADAVVLATDGATAARLLGDLEAPRWRGVTNLHFSAARPPLTGPVLVLGADGDGPVNNLCVMSEVAPEYAPDGKALISVTVLGSAVAPEDELERSVRGQMARWFGTSAADWRLLRIDDIPRALPEQRPPHRARDTARTPQGVYVCGDYTTDSSINGALASGRKAAQAVLEDFGGSRSRA